MSTENSDGYLLDRSDVESQRLNHQHGLYTRNLGYVIHPSIFARLNESSRIADVGTGTGIFLTELSKQLPSSCQLDGFDISNSQFIASDKCPPNLSLYVHDAKESFPPEFHGQYDFVHLRLLVMALDENDWNIVASNVTKLLKPGGALQWEEGSFASAALIRGDPKARPETMKFVYDKVLEGSGHRLRFCFDNLPSIFRANGLTGVFQDTIPSDRDPETRILFTKNVFEAAVIFVNQQLKNGVPHAFSSDEIAQLKSKVDKEIESGGYIRFEVYCTIGWRP